MFLKKEKKTDQCFCRTKEKGRQGVKRCFLQKEGNADMLFAGGDQGPQASCPCCSQNVLVGMTSQDAAGEADKWVDAGGRRTGLGVAREHGGARARAAEMVGMPGRCTRLQAEEKAFGGRGV